MTKLQDVIVEEMKVKKSINSAEEIAELKQFVKAMFNHIHLLNHWY